MKFFDDWIRTADLWCWKRPICQLSHNHHYPISLQLKCEIRATLLPSKLYLKSFDFPSLRKNEFYILRKFIFSK